jgi:hypothetical protein
MDESPKNVYTEDETTEAPKKRSASGQFWALFKQSVIMQALLSVMMVGTYCYLIIIGQAVTNEFYVLLGTIVGFFFGGKMGLAQGKEAAKAELK